jgi:hypothetical protein
MMLYDPRESEMSGPAALGRVVARRSRAVSPPRGWRWWLATNTRIRATRHVLAPTRCSMSAIRTLLQICESEMSGPGAVPCVWGPPPSPDLLPKIHSEADASPLHKRTDPRPSGMGG